jgi:hypothetical protein
VPPPRDVPESCPAILAAYLGRRRSSERDAPGSDVIAAMTAYHRAKTKNPAV